MRGNQSSRAPFDAYLIRGFVNYNFLRNGLLDNAVNFSIGTDTANIERLEVLKGPSSVLYGPGGGGGLISILTKQPLTEPYYSVEGSTGSFDFYRGTIDLSGPLNDNKTLLYRLNTAAQTSGSFIDFFKSERYQVAPVLSWQISDRTKLTLEAEYLYAAQPFDTGIPAVGSVLPNPNGKIPRSRYTGEASDA